MKAVNDKIFGVTKKKILEQNDNFFLNEKKLCVTNEILWKMICFYVSYSTVKQRTKWFIFKPQYKLHYVKSTSILKKISFKKNVKSTSKDCLLNYCICINLLLTILCILV